MLKVLVVDDEENNLEMIKKFGNVKDYDVTTCMQAYDAIKLVNHKEYDVIILDVMMPQINGFELLEQIKKMTKSKVIFLSAKSSLPNRLKGLELGAVDYITKPFSLEELFLKIKNISEDNKNEFIYDGITIDLNLRKVYIDEQVYNLSENLFDLLFILLKNANTPVSRQHLLQEIWNTNEDYSSRTVDIHICKLRTILRKRGYKIVTVRKKGYMYETKK